MPKRSASLADARGVRLMVDHTFVYNGAVRRIRALIDAGELGELLYLDSVRVNLGLFQHDSNVIWDLAVHDLSIMDYLIDARPVAVSADGTAAGGVGHENVAYVTVHFDSGFLAHFHVNWLAPVKIRQMLLGGRQRMLVYDDTDPSEKVRVYDKGVDVDVKDGETAAADSDLLPHRRHVRADLRSARSAFARSARVRRCDRGAARAADRRGVRRARGVAARGRERSRCARKAGGSPFDVPVDRAGRQARERRQDLRLRQFVWLRDWRRVEDRDVCRNPARRPYWPAREDFEPHLHLRRRAD